MNKSNFEFEIVNAKKDSIWETDHNLYYIATHLSNPTESEKDILDGCANLLETDLILKGLNVDMSIFYDAGGYMDKLDPVFKYKKQAELFLRILKPIANKMSREQFLTWAYLSYDGERDQIGA